MENGSHIGVCDVCYWIDADERQKPVSYCSQCDAWICQSCFSRTWRRGFAMAFRKIGFRLRAVGPLPVLFLVLLASASLRAQSVCGAGLQNIPALNATNSIGLIYQNVCWNPVTAAITFPNFTSSGGGITSVFGNTGPVITSLANPIFTGTTTEQSITQGGSATSFTLTPNTASGGIFTFTVPGGDFFTLNGQGQFEALDSTGDNLILGSGVFSLLDSANNGYSEAPAGTGLITESTSMQVKGGVSGVTFGAGITFSSTALTGPASITTSGVVTGTKFASSTNCAVNNAVSPAACGSASQGAIVIPTTTTTYTVNTTAVTAASRIQLTRLSFTSNLPGSPTCVPPAVTAEPTISAISAGASFTITLGSTTGQTCPQFSIFD
jgi:hypothetical protein